MAYEERLKDNQFDDENNNGGNSDKNNTINNLIDNLTYITPSRKNNLQSMDLTELEIQNYEQIKIPKEIKFKISELQKISKSIVKKSQFQPVGAEKQFVGKKYTIDYLKDLNTRQLFAVTVTNKPLLIIAGAGTGKTRTIVYRVSFLIENGIDPSNILILTFTRKAANEMISRTRVLLQNKKAENIIGGTFHSFANFILRKYSRIINLQPNFTIIDAVDSEDIIGLLKDELKITRKDRAFPKKGRVQELISKSRNCSLSIKQIIDREFIGLNDYLEEIELIASAYTKYKKVNNILDFDDLMEVLRDCLKNNNEFREKLQDQFRYILVDEYQDTNLIQKEITDYIAEKHRNITVVGDDSQSIYTFRGANYENILRFPATYPDSVIVKIEENFRSNQGVLDFTNSIIKNAILGYKKNLFSKNQIIKKPIIKKFYEREDEAEYIVTKILEIREKVPLNEMAVLYRATYHGYYIQAELLKRKIPYIVYGGIKFIERRHVRDIIAYLRIIQNPLDPAAWHRILKLLPGIGNISASQILRIIHKNKGQIVFDDFSKKRYYQDLLKLQKILYETVNPKYSIPNKILSLKEYYYPILKSLESDYEIRLQDIDVLYNLSLRYDELEKFLADFAIDPPSNKFQDSSRPLLDESEEKPLVLSTIHSAKGLEWYCVFIPHLIDGLLPSTRSFNNIEDFEEERRLFYVACTRAKEQIYLTIPSYFSSWDAIYTHPSRFIIEIEKDKYILEK